MSSRSKEVIAPVITIGVLQDLQNTRVNLLMDKKGSETITSKSGDVRITTLDGQNSLLADYLGCLLLTK